MNLWLFLAGIIVHYSGTKVFLFMILKTKPTAGFDSPTRKPRPMSSLSLDQKVRFRSRRPCSWYVPRLLLSPRDRTSPRIMFPSKPIWLCRHRRNCLVYVHLLSLRRSWNKSSASFKSQLFRISKPRLAALGLTPRQSARSNFVASGAIATCSYLRARCLNSIYLITTSTFIPHQRQMHTNVATHSRMHSLTSTAKCYQRCLGLAVSTVENHLSFISWSCWCRVC